MHPESMVSLGAGRRNTEEGTMAGAAAIPSAAAFRNSRRGTPFFAFDRDMALSSKELISVISPSNKTYHVEFAVVNVRPARPPPHTPRPEHDDRRDEEAEMSPKAYSRISCRAR